MKTSCIHLPRLISVTKWLCSLVALFFCTTVLFSRSEFAKNPAANLDSAVFYSPIDWIKARGFIDKAFEQSICYNDRRALVNTLILSGREYHLNGTSERGRNELYKALFIAEKMEDDQLKSRIYDNLGLNFRNNYNFKKATHYFDQSLEVKMRYKDTLGWANIISNKACIYRDQQEFEKALYYNDSALTLLNNQEKSPLYYELIFLRSNFHRMLEQYDSSYYYMEIYGRYAEANLPFECTQTYLELATLSLKLGNDELAEEYMEKARASVNTRNNFNTLLILYNDFALYHALQGDFEEAYQESQKAYSQLSLSLQRKLSRQLSNVESEFSLFKEQARARSAQMKKELSDERLYRFMLLFAAALFIIVLLIFLIVSSVINRKKLKVQRTELQRQNEDMRKLNHEKDTLILMISHNLKTPLVGVNYLTKSLVNERLIAENSGLHKKVEIIHGSIQQLLQATDEVIESAKPSCRISVEMPQQLLNLNEIVQNRICIQGEHAEVKKVQINYESDCETTILANRQGLISIIDNLLSNAVKYAEPNTQITIRSRLRSFKYLRVEFQNTSAIHSAVEETDFGSSGVGLLIVKKYLNDLKGKLWRRTGLNGQISYAFIIPVSEATQKSDHF